jgi:hypothetical protein
LPIRRIAEPARRVVVVDARIIRDRDGVGVGVESSGVAVGSSLVAARAGRSGGRRG